MQGASKLVCVRAVVGAVAVVCVSAAMGKQAAPATEPQEAAAFSAAQEGLPGSAVVLSHECCSLTHTNHYPVCTELTEDKLPL